MRLKMISCNLRRLVKLNNQFKFGNKYYFKRNKGCYPLSKFRHIKKTKYQSKNSLNSLHPTSAIYPTN